MPESLEREVERLINLGHKDPRAVVGELVKAFGEDWLRKAAGAHAHEITAELARRLIGQQRRSAEVALRPGDQVTSAEMKLRGMWVPTPDGYQEWKRAADLTDAELDAKAAWLERLAIGVLKRSHWCREVAMMMRAEGAKTMGRLKTPLPPLPDEGMLELPPPSEAIA